MTEIDVRDQLTTLAASAVGWRGELPTGDLAAHLDSMQRMTLVVAIEDHFHIAFEEEDEAELVSIDDVVRVLLRKLNHA